MNSPTFFWHDYETSGADPRRDRPLQFAGQRTSLELEPIGDPVVAWCKPARDTLPQPIACLITGITPQQAEREGSIEAEFAARIHEQLVEPGTCGAGYNSIRFDDEVTRSLLYRNFYEPYAREWQEGNSRWDLIDVLRMAYALRPSGIEWPERAPRTPSFRLEDLASANGLRVGQAHDALSDVNATIALARRLRAAQPKLFTYLFALRDKRKAMALLDWQETTPVLHSSSRIAAERGCTTLVAPLAPHPSQGNAIVVFDLMTDPSALIELPAEEIQDRLFTPQRDLPEGVERIPLKLVRTNHAPALAEMRVLNGTDVARIGLDPERCLAHAQRLRAAPQLRDKVRQVFAQGATRASEVDADLAMVAGGFLRDDERGLRNKIRAAAPDQLARFASHLRDPRYPELLWRYRARNWPNTLDTDERERWRTHRQSRLLREHPASTITLPAYFEQIAALRTERVDDGRAQALLDALQSWGLEIQGELENA